jgi:superoxide dismutase, Fe-Mn family
MDKQLVLYLVLGIASLLLIIQTIRLRRNCPCPPMMQKPMVATKIIVYNLHYPYTLPPLTYDYKALEPYIDSETMVIHHTKHHQAYVDNLNKALAQAPEFQAYSLEMLLANLAALPLAIRERVRANGGGHFNHTLFWNLMTPHGGGQPKEAVLAEINKTFGSFEHFKEQFSAAALGHVGSGWAWLCLTPAKKLVITVTMNHDTPLAQQWYPLLIMDIWEHAYYLKYRNKRGDFIQAWWNTVNWQAVETLYIDALKGLS